MNEDLRFACRAEHQADVVEICQLVWAWCQRQNERIKDETEFVEGANGMQINADLLKDDFDIEAWRKSLQERSDSQPPSFYFCIFKWESPQPPDTYIEIGTNIPIEQLRDLFRQVVDCHVMVQTLASIDEYTGARDYDL